MSAIKLSVLRDIGWKYWDPIGLLGEGDDWQDFPNFADEYDTYLLQISSLVLIQNKDDEAVDYLVRIETTHMGLGDRPGIRDRAKQVVEQIRLRGDEIFPD